MNNPWWITRMFSDATGEPDDARVAAFLIVLAFIFNAIYAVVAGKEHTFDAQQFGIGAGALAAGVGIWFGQRKAN